MVGIFSLADFFVSRQALMVALTLSNVTAASVDFCWNWLIEVLSRKYWHEEIATFIGSIYSQ